MTANRQSRSAPNDRELRLWKVGRTLTLAFAAAVLVSAGVFLSLVVLLDFQEIDKTAKLDAKTLFDLVKLSFGVVAGAGALVALVVAYRRQRVDEAGAHREATRLHTERFSQAVDKLGSDSPAVRLGGVHALAGLADDAPDDSLRQTCIDVLCAYLRLPFPPDPGNPPDDTAAEEQREAHQDKKDRYRALREVRHTILRLIGDHYRTPKGTHHSWQGCNLDLTGVAIDGQMSFTGASFSGGDVSFTDAAFSGGNVSFTDAAFSGGNVSFTDAIFSGGNVSFTDAAFSGGNVSFTDAIFSGGNVSFTDAAFSGGNVHFDGATFSDGYVVSFVGATFSGSYVSFVEARFTGGDVRFTGATFSGGDLHFDNATFSGGDVHFTGATFSGGNVHFDHAIFCGSYVRVILAIFSGGNVSFTHAAFSGGDVRFDHAIFEGSMVPFTGAVFSGGNVHFDATSGPAPAGLLEAVGTPAPAEVRLRPDWLPANP
ncbi:pentapeptide repeat-containing protein [Streptomyces anulatus]|nr:pentapeptide repeat-containing protein [Streptomyces anulatus]MCX4606700.1 pentapeptide repeat-containing protein [Streptomyces anulatus]